MVSSALETENAVSRTTSLAVVKANSQCNGKENFRPPLGLRNPSGADFGETWDNYVVGATTPCGWSGRTRDMTAFYFYIKTCEAGLVLSVTDILRAALTKFRVCECMYVCVCNYSQTT